MTVDLLSVRLKEAKRELTNLKTAHLRGLGLLRLYTKNVNLNVPVSGFAYYIELTVAFTENSSPYPFIQGMPALGEETTSAGISDDGIEYTDNGMKCLLKFSWNRTTPIIDNIRVVSSADILNISQRWW